MLDAVEQVSRNLSKVGTPTKHLQAHLAGLKRLSARASAGPVTPPGTRRVFFSFSAYARNIVDKLKSCKVPISEGLSDEEFDKIEATFGITFPPDLKGILHEALPVGAGFPNWRAGSRDHLSMRINLPIVGLLREVANSSFWWKAWGPRPTDTKLAVRVARTALRRSPILVPIYGHCYIPSSPGLAGNPVFFAYQKNVVFCGYDVADFFDREGFLLHKFEFGDLMYDMGSFRNEKNIEGGTLDRVSRELHQSDSESVHRSSNSSFGTDVSEASGSGSSSGEGETWGRSLDVLAKNIELLVSPRMGKLHSGGLECLNSSRSASRQLSFSRSFDRRSQESDLSQDFESSDDITKYPHIVEKSLPSEILINVSMVQRDARTSRHIEFWSDLAEKVHKQFAVHGESFFSPEKIVSDSSKRSSSPVKKHPERDRMEEKNEAQSLRWLNGYLDEISLVLRQGGWREDDINDMIVSEPPSQRWNQQLDEKVYSTAWRWSTATNFPMFHQQACKMPTNSIS